MTLTTLLKQIWPTKANKDAYRKDRQIHYVLSHMHTDDSDCAGFSPEEISTYHSLDAEAEKRDAQRPLSNERACLADRIYRWATRNWDTGIDALTEKDVHRIEQKYGHKCTP